MLQGRLHFEVDDDVFELAPGDSLHFNSQHRYNMQNRGKADVQVLWVGTAAALSASRRDSRAFQGALEGRKGQEAAPSRKPAMKVVRTSFPEGAANTQSFAKVHGSGNTCLEVGTARLRAGERVPAQGESRHAAIEISYVLGGVVDVVNESGTQRIAAGDLVIVPKNEWHYSRVVEEATLIYAFLEDAPCE